jgi:hypothetical protein
VEEYNKRPNCKSPILIVNLMNLEISKQMKERISVLKVNKTTFAIQNQPNVDNLGITRPDFSQLDEL